MRSLQASALPRTMSRGELGAVTHPGDGAAVKDIAKEAVAVAGQGDQVAVFGFRRLQDLHRRITEGKSPEQSFCRLDESQP